MKWHLAQYGLAALCTVAIAVGIVAVASKQHTKVQTKAVTRNAVFDGRVRSLVEFLHPKASQQIQCPPRLQHAVCIVFVGPQWEVDLAVPRSAAS